MGNQRAIGPGYSAAKPAVRRCEVFVSEKYAQWRYEGIVNELTTVGSRVATREMTAGVYVGGCLHHDISIDSTLLPVASGPSDWVARVWSLGTGKMVAEPCKKC